MSDQKTKTQIRIWKLNDGEIWWFRARSEEEARQTSIVEHGIKDLPERTNLWDVAQHENKPAFLAGSVW